MGGKRIIGWLVDEAQRVELLLQFPPRYERIVAHHVILASGSDAPLPTPEVGEIVGHADDRDGVEALVVRIGGGTDRPGGGTYHITWSLAEGRQARQSNDVIAAHGWADIEPPCPVSLQPAEL
jgi:hypothetical protein